MSLLSLLTRRGEEILDLLAPQRCPLCGRRLERGPRCRPCRLPRRRRVVRQLRADRAGAYLVFGGGPFRGRLRRLVHAFKYRDDAAALRLAARQALLALPPGAAWDAVVPVPAHALRRRERGFDAIGRLARAVGRARGLEVRPLLRRTRPTPTLSGRGRRERRLLLLGAIASGAAAGRLLVVDDVTTSGASFEACRRALLGAGAESADLLVVGVTPSRRPPARDPGGVGGRGRGRLSGKRQRGVVGAPRVC